MSCITLLSDLGLRDATVAAARGILMQAIPNVVLTDITHLVEPYHMQQAAYLLASASRHYPAGTCHIVLFDIFSEKIPRLVLCHKDGQYYLAPDNGVLALAFGAANMDVWICHELQPPGTFKDWITEAGKIAASLQSIMPADLGVKKCELKNAPQNCRPLVEANSVECQVIHIDRFENIVINITKPQFESIGRHRPFRISFMRDEEITEISMHYYDVKPGEKLCRFNDAGYLEIAINRGPAASLIGLQINLQGHTKAAHQLYNVIKIFFE
ncbi:MAG: SAM-dependent chlorinase/fluorinase [Taibaiella sp.]|nr:SAM-dependent chlorinase/fluorinase [Taibaiella sp.]